MSLHASVQITKFHEGRRASETLTHRSHQSVAKATNRFLAKKWDEREYILHRERVANVKSSVDDKAPPAFVHLQVKLRSLQVQEERLALVERNNRILLERMSHIMRTKGYVDHRNNYVPKSLNKLQRQQRILRITHENRAILKRILTTQPATIRREEWEKHFRKHIVYVNDMSCFPYGWWRQKDEKRNLKKLEKNFDNSTVLRVDISAPMGRPKPLSSTKLRRDSTNITPQMLSIMRRSINADINAAPKIKKQKSKGTKSVRIMENTGNLLSTIPSAVLGSETFHTTPENEQQQNQDQQQPSASRSKEDEHSGSSGKQSRTSCIGSRVASAKASEESRKSPRMEEGRDIEQQLEKRESRSESADETKTVPKSISRASNEDRKPESPKGSKPPSRAASGKSSSRVSSAESKKARRPPSAQGFDKSENDQSDRESRKSATQKSGNLSDDGRKSPGKKATSDDQSSRGRKSPSTEGSATKERSGNVTEESGDKKEKVERKDKSSSSSRATSGKSSKKSETDTSPERAKKRGDKEVTPAGSPSAKSPSKQVVEASAEERGKNSSSSRETSGKSSKVSSVHLSNVPKKRSGKSGEDTDASGEEPDSKPKSPTKTDDKVGTTGEISEDDEVMKQSDEITLSEKEQPRNKSLSSKGSDKDTSSEVESEKDLKSKHPTSTLQPSDSGEKSVTGKGGSDTTSFSSTEKSKSKSNVSPSVTQPDKTGVFSSESGFTATSATATTDAANQSENTQND